MANIQITQLPSAGAITGTEAVPIVQNGQTVQTTTAAISASPSQTQTFVTVNQEPTLTNSRALTSTSGIGVTDNGAQSTLSLSLQGAAASLNSAATGFAVKTNTNTITPRNIAVSGSGVAITDGDGQAGNPTIALTGQVLNLANASGAGFISLNGSGALSPRQITGTTSQIDVTNGTGASGDPVISIASNPQLVGTGSVLVPSGTTGQRSSSAVNGMFRYNSTTATFEGYANSAWGSITTGTGVTSIATGTGLTGGPITSTGTISIDVTGVVAATYGSSLVVPVIAVNAQGQITSATNTTINAVTLTTGTISTTPSNSTDIANKAYVDTIAQGLDTKASVVAGTTVNITLSGTQTVDGVVLIAGDRVLVKNQTASADNGLYLCAAGAWTRTTDMNTWAQVPGAYVFVEQGTTLADTGWVCTSNAGGTIGVTAITWAQFSGAGSGVSSINFGTTGLTPASATTGAVTVAGTLAVANGGTGQASALTQYGVVYGSTATAMASTAAGTTTTVLHGNASGAPSFGAVSLTADISGTLPVANGGTNITSYAVGDLIYASTTGVLSKLADVATGNALISGGVGVAPSYGKIALTTHVSGTLPVANGGTGLTAGTSGGILAYTATGTLASSALLAANALMIGGGAGVAPSTTTTGTGVVTALGINTGTAGAFVVNGGALGTPSSGTVTNLTGTASININGTVGATTATTGAFTTVTATTGIFGGTF